MDEMLYAAQDIAARAHASQKDRFTGEAYLRHPLRVCGLVVARGGSLDAAIVAVLHDAVEDSMCPEQTVREIIERFGDHIAELVIALSRKSDESYSEHILRCKEHPITKLVKDCDLDDHLDIDRLHKTLDEEEVSAILKKYSGMFKKYEKAKKILNRKEDESTKTST